MFTPKWKKEAKLLHKGAQKFLHYKRDLLEQEKIDIIEQRREELLKSVKAGDQEATKKADRLLTKACENSLPRYRRPNALEENIEVFFVAIVVALGIRAYYLQPFRIPTGSMQPTLNGIISQSYEGDKEWNKPWAGKQLADFALKGRRYYNIGADRDLTIRRNGGVEDASWFLFTRSKLNFTDGSSVTINCPTGEVYRIPTVAKAYIQNAKGQIVGIKPGPHFRAGEPIFKGSLTSGDLVLVDKFSYNFRQPNRGETFVFDTRGIKRIHESAKLNDQNAGSHYIKRLAGVPGDTLRIDEPTLYINGEIAQETGFKNVASKENGFGGYTNAATTAFHSTSHTVTLQENEDQRFHEYFALGDNSNSSSDSRYWGTVKQYNLVGPAFMSLWPFTSGHWGLID